MKKDTEHILTGVDRQRILPATQGDTVKEAQRDTSMFETTRDHADHLAKLGSKKFAVVSINDVLTILNCQHHWCEICMLLYFHHLEIIWQIHKSL